MDVLEQPVLAVIATDGRKIYPAGKLWEARPDTAVRVWGRVRWFALGHVQRLPQGRQSDAVARQSRLRTREYQQSETSCRPVL